MILKVKESTGKTYEIDVEPYQTFSDIIVKMSDLTGIDVENIRVIYAGRNIFNDFTLSYLDVIPYSTIHIVYRL